MQLLQERCAELELQAPSALSPCMSRRRTAAPPHHHTTACVPSVIARYSSSQQAAPNRRSRQVTSLDARLATAVAGLESTAAALEAVITAPAPATDPPLK
jgi:hypothetical protein